MLNLRAGWPPPGGVYNWIEHAYQNTFYAETSDTLWALFFGDRFWRLANMAFHMYSRTLPLLIHAQNYFKALSFKSSFFLRSGQTRILANAFVCFFSECKALGLEPPICSEPVWQSLLNLQGRSWEFLNFTTLSMSCGETLRVLGPPQTQSPRSPSPQLNMKYVLMFLDLVAGADLQHPPDYPRRT